MSADLSRQDQLLVDRFVDGELAGEALAAARLRLEREPLLRAAVQQRRQLRAGFAAGRETVFAAPKNFADGVLAAARRLPTGEAIGDVAVTACRRVLWLAAAVAIAAVVWQSGLFRGCDTGSLQAAPDEIRRVIDDLDAKVRAQAAQDGAHK